jgi:hypothetical protein
MGATPHTTNDSLAWLRERFKDRLISRKCEIEWAVHSPDLNPPYFYLWGFLKDNVLNFSLWMIFPQSFSHLSQFAYNFYVLSKWHPRRWRHTCIRRAKLSMTRIHSSLGMSLIFAVMAAFSSPIVLRKIIHRLKLRSTKFEELWWTYVGLINILRGHPVYTTASKKTAAKWNR